MAGAGTGAKEATTTIPAAFVPGFWVRDLVRRQRMAVRVKAHYVQRFISKAFFRAISAYIFLNT
jgi:hypothetical protein